MAATISEHYQSRPFTLGKSPGRELVYNVLGTDDEAEVQALILGAAPGSYLGLSLDSVEAEPMGGGAWKGYARYTRLNDDEYTFEIGGGTQHVTQGFGTVNAYAPGGFTPPDFQGAIGVTDDRVEGVDLPGPRYAFSETHYFPAALVTDAYKLVLFQLGGRTFNDATFKNFAAGECAFLGATGSKRGDENWAITFRFEASPNVTGLDVGGITGIDKLGWDYLWFRYGVYEDSGAFALVHRPTSAHVERVLSPGDYSQLGIGV